MSVNKQNIEDILRGLKNMIAKLTLNKETLWQQTEKVSQPIEALFDIQTDALNQRKLLYQLNLIKNDKIDFINRKQEEVVSSLNNIEKILFDSSDYCYNHIKEYSESINNLIIKDIRPFITFNSDPALLREIISQYGVIIKQYGGNFADPNRTSISLPNVVEEDDDENITCNTNNGTKNVYKEDKQVPFPKKSLNSSIFSDILKPFVDIQNQENLHWLAESHHKDNGDELCKIVREACVINNTSSDYSQKDYFHKLEHIPYTRITFTNEFSKIVNSDTKNWLEGKKDNSKMLLKRARKCFSDTESACKLARTESFREGLIFNESLEKWINLGRNATFESINKSVSIMTLDECDEPSV